MRTAHTAYPITTAADVDAGDTRSSGPSLARHVMTEPELPAYR